MDQLRTEVIERAYQLARTGTFSKVIHIIKALRREGYDTDVIVGKTLGNDLRKVIREATPKPITHESSLNLDVS